MRKLITTTAAVAMLAVPGAAMAAGGGNTVCDGSHDLSGTVNANMTVAAGTTCGFWARSAATSP